MGCLSSSVPRLVSTRCAKTCDPRAARLSIELRHSIAEKVNQPLHLGLRHVEPLSELPSAARALNIQDVPEPFGEAARQVCLVRLTCDRGDGLHASKLSGRSRSGFLAGPRSPTAGHRSGRTGNAELAVEQRIGVIEGQAEPQGQLLPYPRARRVVPASLDARNLVAAQSAGFGELFLRQVEALAERANSLAHRDQLGRCGLHAAQMSP